MNERRKPLGGVLKSTYVHSGGHELTYDLIAGIKSDLCHEIRLIQEDTAEIKSQCSCRMGACNKKFVTRAQVYWATIIICSFLSGLGILNWHELKKIAAIFS